MGFWPSNQDQRAALFAALGRFGQGLSAGASTQGWGALGPAISEGIGGYAEVRAAQQEKERQAARLEEIKAKQREALKAVAGNISPSAAAALGLLVGSKDFETELAKIVSAPQRVHSVKSGGREALVREKPNGTAEQIWQGDPEPPKPEAKQRPIRVRDGDVEVVLDPLTREELWRGKPATKSGKAAEKPKAPALLNDIQVDQEAYKRAQVRMKNEIGKDAEPGARADAWKRIIGEERDAVTSLNKMPGVVGGSTAKGDNPPATLTKKIGENKGLQAAADSYRKSGMSWSAIEALLDEALGAHGRR